MRNKKIDRLQQHLLAHGEASHVVSRRQGLLELGIEYLIDLRRESRSYLTNTVSEFLGRLQIMETGAPKWLP